MTSPSASTSVEVDRVDALRALEAEVGVLIRRVRRVIGERARTVHPDLQPASYLMLSHVRQHGPLRASALCVAFHSDKGAVSRQVQHLLDLGLVDRSPDPADGRATLLTASQDAVARLDAVAEERSEMLARRLDEWPAEAIDDFAGMLRRYNEALNTLE